MTTRNLSNEVSIQVGVDTSKIESYKSIISKQLAAMSQELFIIPDVNWENINKLKAELTALAKTQVVKLEVDETEAINSVNKIGTELASNFSKAFSQVAGDKMLQNVASAMKEVAQAAIGTKSAASETEDVLKKLGSTASTEVTEGTGKLASRLRSLAEAFKLFSTGADGLDDIKVGAGNIKSIIDSISTQINNADAFKFKAELDVERTLTNIGKQKSALQGRIDDYGAILTLPANASITNRDEDGKPIAIEVPVTLNKEETLKNLEAAYKALNNSELNTGIKVKLDTTDLKTQLEKTFNVKLNFGDSETKIKDIKESLEGLKTTISEIPKIDFVPGASAKKTSREKVSTETEISPASVSVAETHNEMLAVYNLLETIANKIGDSKQRNNNLDREAIALQREKARAEEAELTSNKKLAQTMQKDYLSSIKDQQKFASNPESESYRIASDIVTQKEREYNAQLEILKLREADRIALERNLELEKQAIANRARLKEAQNTDNIDKNLADVQRASTQLLGIETSLKTKGRTSNLLNTEDFQSYISKLNQAKGIAEQLHTQLQNGDTTGFKEQYASLDDLVKKLKLYNDEVTQINKKPVIDSKEIDKINKLGSEMTSYMNKYGSEIRKNADLYTRFIALQNKLANQSVSSIQGRSEFANLQIDARNLGLEIDTVWSKLSRTFGSRLRSLIAGQGWFMISASLRDVYRNVVEIDTAMTELKKVTNETESGYNRFLDNAVVRAKNLGATLTEVINSTADFARLGYNIPDASQLSDTALVYLNVGDDVENIDQATKSVISTMQGFGVEASKSMSIVDKFNEVSNNYATSAGDIGEGMLRSASALDAANNSLDESIALFTAGQEVVQNAESMGTVLKTTSMRIRGAETELAEAGLDTEGMASSVSKLRDELMSLTGGFDIMEDGGETFKSTYNILKGIAEVWGQLTDVSQANVLELLAGKRNGNALAAILGNFDTADAVLKTSQESSGSALRENEVYLNSIQGKLDKLTATWQSFSSHLLDSGAAKGTVSAFTGLLDVVDKLVDMFGTLPILIGAATTALYKFGEAGKDCALLPQVA